MKIYSTYSVKIKHYNSIFKQTIRIYRDAVDFFIQVCLQEWDVIKEIDSALAEQSYVESLCIRNKSHPEPKYNFASAQEGFYKHPSYLRRASITEAIGKVSSYKSNLKNWENSDVNARGRIPGEPKAGFIYPCFYRYGQYVQTGDYSAKIKIFVRNTWD